MIGNQGVNAKCLFFSAENIQQYFSKFDDKNIKNIEIKKDLVYSTEFPYMEIMKIFLQHVEKELLIILTQGTLFITRILD